MLSKSILWYSVDKFCVEYFIQIRVFDIRPKQCGIIENTNEHRKHEHESDFLLSLHQHYISLLDAWQIDYSLDTWIAHQLSLFFSSQDPEEVILIFFD